MYIGILKRAYYLEALGESTYRHGAKRVGNETDAVRWIKFAQTEDRMRHLIQDELTRVKRSWKPSSWTALGVRVMGFLSQLLGSYLLMGMISKVLDRRRYSAWSTQVADRNPALWQELVAHEVSQVLYLESRRAR